MTKKQVSRRLVLAAGAATAGLLAVPSILRAQSYATRPVRLFVGTAAAGSNDLVGRLLAQPLERLLGQPVVVENRPGGATSGEPSEAARAGFRLWRDHLGPSARVALG